MIAQGKNRDEALTIAEVSKHQYYHTPTESVKGKKPSTHTTKLVNGMREKICNLKVVQEIRLLQEDDVTDYGYIKVAYELKTRGYEINKKKVYRLMKLHHLLKAAAPKGQKKYVKYRRVTPAQPLELIEMDIKMVWIELNKQFAYILNIIDTFTRVVLYHIALFTIKQKQVKEAWDYVIVNHLQPNDCLNRKIEIEVRNDNDKRFSALSIKAFFETNYLNQVFTHPYTPQENGHIESFHGILSKHLSPKRYWSIDELKQDLVLFYEKYNNKRIHASICQTAPNTFWELYKRGLVITQCNIKSRNLKFKLKIPHNKINENLERRPPKTDEVI